MGTTDTTREQLVRRALLQRAESVGSASTVLWDRLATDLISIIGHGGFAALYSRSIHHAGMTFTWLSSIQLGQSSDLHFADLKSRLEGREATEAREASVALLTTFIHILEALIGELLTTRILQSAWGEDATDTPEKEVQQ